jgi:hypothetical protein
MAAQKEDYLLRLLIQLRDCVAGAAGLRRAGRFDEALQLSMQAQERLFGRPLTEVMGQAMRDQLDTLVAGAPPAMAAEKCALFAALLGEAAAVYRGRGPADLAPAAWTMAGQFVLAAAERFGPEERGRLERAAKEILDATGPGDLPSGLREALARLAGVEPGYPEGVGRTLPNT